MDKTKTQHRCNACGFVTSKWMGRCPQCDAWDTLQPERVTGAGKAARRVDTVNSAPPRAASRAVPLSAVDRSAEQRISTGSGELDRVLGGGLVRGSVVLVGGEPGIGKSTLLLQAAAAMQQRGARVLYVSGEESPAQIRLRADRLGIGDSGVELLIETDVEALEDAATAARPDVLIVDSVQTLRLAEVDSQPGSINQVRQATARLVELAKHHNVTVLLVGHVTKEGSLAGPKVTEHMVDVVLMFEGERALSLKMLRSAKNRFGATHEIGLFEMSDGGLREVVNPSQLLLAERASGASGTVATCVNEGTRPLLCELQALVAPSPFAAPRRVASGLDLNRLHLILAVLEQRQGLRLGGVDVYVNVVGGLRVNEPATDLAVALAVASARSNVPLPTELMVFGEVGLTGEVRAVNRPGRRLEEAARLGFTRCILPRHGLTEVEVPPGIQAVPVRRLDEALAQVVEEPGAAPGATRPDRRSPATRER